LQQVSAATVLRDITLLSSIFEHARRERRLIDANPIRDLRKPSTPRPRERLPTDFEIERICIALGYERQGQRVETFSAQVAVAFLIAIESAMRAGEILSLTWDQVDTGKRVVSLEKTKNGDRRQVPLSIRAVDLIEQMRGIDPVRVFTVSAASRDSLFRKAKRRAGVSGLSFHDSRALALTRLSKKLNVLELARMVGHRDPRSLMVYYRESAEEIAKKL
jgi:integrase